MALRPRLALRSSHKSGVDFAEVPATVIHPNSSPNTRKRSRDPSTDQDDRKLTKRLHDGPESTSTARNVKVYSRKPTTKQIVLPADLVAVTQVAARPSTPPAQLTLPAQQSPNNSANADNTNSQNSTGLSFTLPEVAATEKADKRSLRSHGSGSRFKSELALYFADYDEILTDESRTQGFLKPATRIYIVDEPSKPYGPDTIPSSVIANHRSCGDDNLTLNDAKQLDFSSTERHTRHIIDDPLTSELYFKAHRRAERGEKSHKNREKESAQHEKFQLERILEELKGQSWLKCMGITGITESEKKIYEPKRAIFIQRVTALLDKFKAWKEEEKRRKAERERTSATDEEEEADEDEEMETDQSQSPGRYDGVNERRGRARGSGGSARARRHGFRDSTSARVEESTASKSMGREDLNPWLSQPERPCTSFYAKPYLREAALSKHRRGRVRFAFGQQLPDLEQRDFNLPSELLTTKLKAANARSRRAARRVGKES
ncbi:MAG: hypothetical protein LQ348_002153 [Seirophora lacunosa]|nr:MAG: hypothetical protein LQ348_002153 [Seirophora lacunosa]